MANIVEIINDQQIVVISEAGHAGADGSAFTPVDTLGSPGALSGSVAIAVSNPAQINFIVSNGGAVSMSANPQIAVGTQVGQLLKLRGTSDTNYVTFNNGNGLIQNGEWLAKNGSVIQYSWDGTYWCEDFRNDI